MPDYAAQISPADRWKIVAYVKALQLSQHAEREQLSPGDVSKLGGQTPPEFENEKP
jgi:hypothetical protein